MEVVSGTMTNDACSPTRRTRSDERLHGLNYLFGAKLVPVDTRGHRRRRGRGQVEQRPVAGDVLARKGLDLAPVHTAPATPAMSVALVGASHDDDDKIATALHRLAEEDPSLHVRHDPISRASGRRRHG